jgi:two-component system, sensor histidine kinase and response regulator
VDTLRVLVVDDEPGMREGVARALRGFTVTVPGNDGACVIEAAQSATAEEALEAHSQHPADIVLLDHKLPGMSGIDLLGRLADQQADLLVIMITAYASLETAIAATKRGAYDFLAKPFTPQELKDAIRKAAHHLLVQRQARRLAEERRQVRFEFISVLAHELKNPLAAVEGYLQLLKDRQADGDPAMYDRIIDRSLARLEGMRKLILDLLDLTQIESGLKKRQLTQVDLQEAAQQAIGHFRQEASARRITIGLDANGAVEMQADRGEIDMVLSNLVSNAVKYNREGGRVDVGLRSGNGTMTITVADTGIGMTADEAAQLFGEFSRVRNEKTRNILGSGLGLSIVKKIASLYDGEASVTSEPGVGSTFTVTLKR